MNNPATNDPLWDYMDRIRWRLRRIPEAESAEALREIRQHMEDLVADYMAAGAWREEAVRKAEKKFGSPEKVADRLITGSRRNPAFTFFLIICNSCWIVFSLHPTFAWSGIVFMAALGAIFGGLWAFEPTRRFRKYRDSRQKRTEVFWIVAAVTLLALQVATSPWSLTKTAMIEYALGGATGVPTYFLVKTLRQRHGKA